MKKQALCVGINDYPGVDADLRGCVNDATDWTAELKKRGFTVTLMTDAMAKKDTIVQCLTAMMADASPGDHLAFTFSGHGTWVPDADGDESDRRDEALCPYDLDTELLIDDELSEILYKRQIGVKVTMITDSCHSGTVMRSGPSRQPRKFRGLHPTKVPAVREILARRQSTSSMNPISATDITDSVLLSVESKPIIPKILPGIVHLSGCMDKEYSYDASYNGRPNGALTYCALQALKGLPEGASYNAWYRNIRRALPSWDYPQTPRLNCTRTPRYRWRIFD